MKQEQGGVLGVTGFPVKNSMIADGGSAVVDHGLISLCRLDFHHLAICAWWLDHKQCVNSYADFVPLHACPVIGYQQHPGGAEPARRPFVSSRKCCAHLRQLSEMRGTASNRSTSSRSRV